MIYNYLNKLWIAFKKLYLWYSEQPVPPKSPASCSCELLSKNCIFDILNNDISKGTYIILVVNCFQKIVSLIFWTTVLFVRFHLACCELLSKNCIFDILNNTIYAGKLPTSVVNCFQKIVSLIFWTTLSALWDARLSLWIAFKKLYLWYSEQLCFLFVFT